MRLTNNEVAKIVLECGQKCGCEDFIDKISFRWNYRMRTAMGRARIVRKPLQYIMLLNPHLFDRASQEKQRNTVIHEVCHLIDGYINGTMKGHGRMWQLYMRRCGETPERCHNEDVTGLKRTHKVTRVNAHCGCVSPHKITKHRATKMKKGHRYVCRSCNQRLSLTIEPQYRMW